jgi:ketosteroid isomerase-like protein
MNRIQITTFLLLSGLAVCTPARAQTIPGAAAFERIKGLVGEWRAPEGSDVMINIFRPIAFGSAILHEEWKKGEQLTATVFYMVGSELRADHFCDFKNQLRYVVKPSPDSSALLFELRDATNLDVQPRHFHSATWRFVDATHHTQDWHMTGGDRPPRVARLEFTRQDVPTNPSRPKPVAEVEQELRELDRQWAELAVKGDTAAYDRLTDENHIATHASGKLVTRAQELSYLATSASRFAAITTDDVDVRVDGDTAVILGRVTVKMRTGTEGQYRYTTVWRKRSDRWRIVAEQHTRIEAPSR